MKTKPSETLRQMALTDRKLSWLGAVAETIAELEEDNARKDDAIADQARKIKGLLAQLVTVKRERDAAVRDIREMLVEQGGNFDLCHWCRQVCDDKCLCDADADWRGPCAENGGENV